ncbi:MAG TPA: VOC family protein [Candidatus Acidoferrales bacterium]|nr:VOC family protein [Candidatus Acidoferrales bacterium]
METKIDSLLGDYESGKVSRREFVERLTVMAGIAAGFGAAMPPPAAAASGSRITPVSVNHIAITVSDLGRAKDWYTGLLNLKVVQETPRLALLRFKDTEFVLRPGPHPGTITHFMLGVEPYDEVALKAQLLAHGLEPRKDLESFLVKAPDDLTLQIGDRQMGLKSGYPAANS